MSTKKQSKKQRKEIYNKYVSTVKGYIKRLDDYNHAAELLSITNEKDRVEYIRNRFMIFITNNMKIEKTNKYPYLKKKDKSIYDSYIISKGLWFSCMVSAIKGVENLENSLKSKYPYDLLHQRK